MVIVEVAICFAILKYHHNEHLTQFCFKLKNNHLHAQAVNMFVNFCLRAILLFLSIGYHFGFINPKGLNQDLSRSISATKKVQSILQRAEWNLCLVFIELLGLP